MRQVSCTNLTVNDSNIVSAINVKQNIIGTTKDVQMRNLTCNSVDIAGTNVIILLDAIQEIIQDGDFTIDRTMGLQKSLDDLTGAIDNKQDIIGSNTEISLKSLTVGGADFVSTQAIAPILLDPPTEGPNIGEIQCVSLIINEVLDVEEKKNAQTISIAELQLQVRFGIPICCISMWPGTTIPIFWVKCDGTNGTPNLIDKFLIGPNTAGITGGSSNRTLSTSNLPPHNHTFSGNTSTVETHKHWMNVMPPDDRIFSGTGGRGQEYGLVSDQGSYDTNADQNQPGKWTTNQGSHNHSFSGTTINTGSGTSFSIEPPYYSIIYIM